MYRLCLFLLSIHGITHAATVRVERVPEGGLQPQIAQDGQGLLHLVYLTGAPGGCDIRYATRKPGDPAWSTPITVNNEAHTAVAMGTIRGAQLALGREGTVHVVWNGPGAKDLPSSLFYTRKEAGKAAFEPQRDLRADTKGLDGGASIAASPKGEVFVVWHGKRNTDPPGENTRLVFVRKSANDGVSFAPATIANLDDTGVCACCSMKSFVTPLGGLFALYRAARRPDQRDVTLLSSRDGGQTFDHRIIGPWAIAACPMSSMRVSHGQQTRAAWEAEGQIFTTTLESSSGALAVSDHNARHPALAVNASGETLIAWSVGTGWQRGGSMAWKLLDPQGKPTAQQGRAEGVPVWGLTAAYADADGFVVMY